MPALGLTDHGVMNGAVELYKACKAGGIKPIIGLEAYLVDDRTRRRRPRYERNHLTLSRASDEGFRNLVKPHSAGSSRASRAARRTSTWSCSRHSEGVIALTGCLQSRFCRRLVEDRPDDARAHIDDLIRRVRPEQVYFEVQRNGIPEQDKANEGIAKVAGELGGRWSGPRTSTTCAGRTTTTTPRSLCVQTKSTLAQPKLSFDTNEFYLKSPEEEWRHLSGVAGGGPRPPPRSRSAARSRWSSATSAAGLRDPRGH